MPLPPEKAEILMRWIREHGYAEDTINKLEHRGEAGVQALINSGQSVGPSPAVSHLYLNLWKEVKDEERLARERQIAEAARLSADAASRSAHTAERALKWTAVATVVALFAAWLAWIKQ